MSDAAGEGEEPVVAAAAAVYGLLTALLRGVPREMSLTAMAAMSTLERTGPKRITELASIEGVTQPTMTTLVATLEKAGLAQRAGDPADRRVSLVSLTNKGMAYIRERRRAGTMAFAALVADLPPDEAAALAAAIPAMERLRDLDSMRRFPGPRGA